MFKKLEAWFRRIVSEEVSIVRDEFTQVSSKFSKEIKDLDSEFASALKGFEGAFEKELSTIEAKLLTKLEEVSTLYQERIEAKVKAIEETIHKDLSHWTAEDDVVKADHALRKVK